MTSKTKKVAKAEYGRTSVDQVLWYLDLLAKCGFADAVLSPQETNAARKAKLHKYLDLDTPGIVLGGADADDQARTDTPAGALKAGATRLVIGRALTNGDWAENYRLVAAEVDKALAA
jgi:orotidine-5'-phosphate decarboxylase